MKVQYVCVAFNEQDIRHINIKDVHVVSKQETACNHFAVIFWYADREWKSLLLDHNKVPARLSL